MSHLAGHTYYSPAKRDCQGISPVLCYYHIMKNLLAKRLTELIAESGKSQNEIASDLKISKQKLSNWKLGYYEPELDAVLMLAEYFNVTTDYLLGKTDF